jgi:UDP:flavonoid glycosyltransferase YjiC (YdhE family)
VTQEGDGRPAVRAPIVLATSNGTGMGHLTRQVAVAMALRPAAEPVVFSMSTALPVITAYGLRGEYCPSHERGWMPTTRWPGYLKERLLAFLAETAAPVFAFDGVVPYLGVLLARRALPDVAFVWFRRGMWRAGANTRALRAAPLFDLVIEPGDLAATTDAGATAHRADAVRIPPISLVECVQPLPRAEAAAELGLDPNRPAALVTLGSVARHDDALRAALGALLTDPAWQIAVIRSHIARTGLPDMDPARVVELRKIYPLARYLRAFDAAISAAGYNSFHELLLSGIPTLLVPSPQAVTDDQAARATWAGAQGIALVAGPGDADAVAKEAARLLDPALRADLTAACGALPKPTGAAQAARLLNSLVDSFDRHIPERTERLRTATFAAQERVMRVIGPRGTTAVRRLLGRTVQQGPVRRLPVRFAEAVDTSAPGGAVRPLLLTERIDALTSDAIVEHLLAGSSAMYRRARRRIASGHYDVVP